MDILEDLLTVGCLTQLWLAALVFSRDSRVVPLASAGASLLGLAAGASKRRWAYLAYALAALAALCCFADRAVLAALGQAAPLGAVGAFAAVVALGTPLAACRLAGARWAASAVGVACSFVSLAEVAWLVFDGGPRTLLAASSLVEALDCLLAIPSFLYEWDRLIRFHTLYGIFSAGMLVVSAEVALRAMPMSDGQALRRAAALVAVAAVTCAADLACSAVLLLT